MFNCCYCLFNTHMTSLSSLIYRAFVSDVIIQLNDPRGWQNLIKTCGESHRPSARRDGNIELTQLLFDSSWLSNVMPTDIINECLSRAEFAS